MILTRRSAMCFVALIVLVLTAHTPPVAATNVNCAPAGLSASQLSSFTFRNGLANPLQLTACRNATSLDAPCPAQHLANCSSLVEPHSSVTVVMQVQWQQLRARVCANLDARPGPTRCGSVVGMEQFEYTYHPNGYGWWKPQLLFEDTEHSVCTQDLQCIQGSKCLVAPHSPAPQGATWRVCTQCPGTTVNAEGIVVSVCSGHGSCAPPANLSLPTAGTCTCGTDYVAPECTFQAPDQHLITELILIFIALAVVVAAACVWIRRRKRRQLAQESSIYLLGTRATLSTINSAKKHQHLIRFSEVTVGAALGQGASAMVYRGTYAGADVAIKRIYCPSRLTTILDTFLNEAALLASLLHPRIVRFYGLSAEKPFLYIITELCPNGCMDTVLHSCSAPPLKWRFDIALQVAYGMAFLHSQNVVHRDLKPGNVLLDEDRCAKICDFGLARESSQKNMTGFIGTPAYMAPETMAAQLTKYNSSVDVYSFGIMLSELLTWQAAYQAVQVESLFVLRDQVCMHNLRPDIPDAVSQACNVSSALTELCKDCWNGDPGLRPSFTQVTQQLEAVLADSETAESFVKHKDLHATVVASKEAGGAPVSESKGGSMQSWTDTEEEV